METPTDQLKLQQLANAVKLACIKAAEEGFENAAMDGLCNEGMIEAAVSAIQRLEIQPLVENALTS